MFTLISLAKRQDAEMKFSAQEFQWPKSLLFVFLFYLFIYLHICLFIYLLFL